MLPKRENRSSHVVRNRLDCSVEEELSLERGEGEGRARGSILKQQLVILRFNRDTSLQ